MHKRTKPKNPPALQVIVTVSGGVADILFKPVGVTVLLYDYDVQSSDQKQPGVFRDPDGEFCCVGMWSRSDKIVGSEHWPVIRNALKGAYSRTWKCPDCGRKVDCSYEQLAEAGTPLCTDCNTEMEMQ